MTRTRGHKRGLALAVVALATLGGCNELLDVNERILYVDAGASGDGAVRGEGGGLGAVEAGIVGEND